MYHAIVRRRVASTLASLSNGDYEIALEFPFNLGVGIPLYTAMVGSLYR